MIKWALTPVTVVLIRDRRGGNTGTQRRDTMISEAGYQVMHPQVNT